MKALAYSGFINEFGPSKYWGFWFRLFGYGVAVSNMTPMFSERYGLIKVTRIFGIKFELLTPGGPPK